MLQRGWIEKIRSLFSYLHPRDSPVGNNQSLIVSSFIVRWNRIFPLWKSAIIGSRFVCCECVSVSVMPSVFYCAVFLVPMVCEWIVWSWDHCFDSCLMRYCFSIQLKPDLTKSPGKLGIISLNWELCKIGALILLAVDFINSTCHGGASQRYNDTVIVAAAALAWR